MRKFLFAVLAALALCLSGAGVAYAGDNTTSKSDCGTNSCGDDTDTVCLRDTPLLKVDARRLLNARVGDDGTYCAHKVETTTTSHRKVTVPADNCDPQLSARVWLRGLYR